MRKARLINAAVWLAFWLALAIVFDDGLADPREIIGQGGIPLLAWFLSDWALRRIARRQRARCRGGRPSVTGLAYKGGKGGSPGNHPFKARA